ncbi:TetR/AcrR family transcriptional regulator [Bifidobacterium olomucense]|uniref:TetR/AcrR family transcriptional regulator n=1 Tax=Bifidobacterium olomucense TaxID=2675324 RepID=UPI00145F0752|nr:TetR/AcrR family transcriptional regulator [Bifidobacterium sp. DSM 109959]
MVTDLRIVKTRKAIREAFLHLRASGVPVSKVKVKDICDLALVNPSTFYKHYLDVYDLNDNLEDETIDAMLEHYPDKDKILSDPPAFLNGWRPAIDSQIDDLRVLFAGRPEAMFRKIESTLVERYSARAANERERIAAVFSIAGALHSLGLLKLEGGQSDDEIIAAVVENLNAIAARIPDGR